jgi:phage replication initiation protein
LPPPTNRGGKFPETVSTVKLCLENGVIKEIPQRRGWGGDAAFIDWVNFTIGDETIDSGSDTTAIRFAMVNGEVVEIEEGGKGESPITPDQVMIYMSNRLKRIFGFGITSKRDMGANFYRESWVLGDAWGMVCYGGQRHTIMVTLNGTGCAAAKEGWEGRLKAFLETAQRSRLTRLDLAHDDYSGETYNVNQADLDHTNGLFNCGGRNPDCEYRGNWKSPNGKGRTFNIGNRANGKFCRIYEKGRQLGDENSEWVRIEVEFKSCDRVIPFDALLRPGEYLAASYPAFAWISERQERIMTTQKVCSANVDKAVKWIRHQCGASIGLMVDLFGVESFLEKVRRDGNPAWSKVPNFLLSPEGMTSKVGRISLEVAADNPAFC